MGYTLSFDASVKVTRDGVGGFLRHICRDLDQANGCEVRHSNTDIDAARTQDNETLIRDGKGGWYYGSGTDLVALAIDECLKGVKKPMRKDAVVLRPLILQLDPEWYASHQDAGERQRVADTMLKWAEDTFGHERLVYASIHNDENSPHMHVGFCPVTDDGRLSQKDWFRSPEALRAMHQDFRETMAAAGYDIDMKRRKPGKHAKRLSESEYKDFAELRKQTAELEKKERELDIREGQLMARERAIKAREELLDEVTSQEYQDELKRRQKAAESVQEPSEDAQGTTEPESVQEPPESVQGPKETDAISKLFEDMKQPEQEQAEENARDAYNKANSPGETLSADEAIDLIASWG